MRENLFVVLLGTDSDWWLQGNCDLIIDIVEIF